jgi:hypothetical protein
MLVRILNVQTDGCVLVGWELAVRAAGCSAHLALLLSSLRCPVP